MTLNNLVDVFYDAEAKGTDRDAIAAVVRALRDEMAPKSLDLMSIRFSVLRELFNEILGDDAGPKDDGVLIGNQNVEAIINDLHDEQQSIAAADLCTELHGYQLYDGSCSSCGKKKSAADPKVCIWVKHEGLAERFEAVGCKKRRFGWKTTQYPPNWFDMGNEHICPDCGKPIKFQEQQP